MTAGSCSAGYFCDSGGKAADDADKLCPEGHYCPDLGTLLPTRCPEGKITIGGGKALATDCQDCAAGYYCPEAGGSYVCPVGHYCPLGSNSPIPCPAGKYDSSH